MSDELPGYLKLYPKKENKNKIHQSVARRNGLGPFFNSLPDFLIMKILCLLDEKSLIMCSMVSKILCFFSEEDKIWKRATIKKRRGDFKFKGSWKRTAVYEREHKKPLPFQRLSVPEGFYSNYLFRKWYRRFVPLKQWDTIPKNRKLVERRSNLSLKEFIEEYDKKNKPVIITDIVQNWPAYKEWDISKLCKRFGNSLFKTDEVDVVAKEKLYIGFTDYIDYLKWNNDEDPIYLFDNKFGERDGAKSLLKDYDIPIYFQQDYFQYLEEERPPYRWFIIGPARSGSPWHTDPYRTSAWNALISGRKRWFLYPYEQHPPGIEVEWDKNGNFESDSPEPVKWLVEHYPNIPDEKAPIECIMEPGDLIFIPSGWWHCVINLTDTVAVTQNLCNDQNFEIVCAELDFDDEEMYEDFQTRVTKKFPNIKWPKKLVTSGFRK